MVWVSELVTRLSHRPLQLNSVVEEKQTDQQTNQRKASRSYNLESVDCAPSLRETLARQVRQENRRRHSAEQVSE